MRTFIETLAEHGFRGRKIGLIENGSWAPVAAKVMKGLLEGCRDTVFAENTVKILSSVSEENLARIDALADEMME
jgi:flavorubredoxin